MYGLKKEPEVWYNKLTSFLLENKFHKGSIDTTFFTKKKNSHILIVKIYVDDIVFGSTDDIKCLNFLETMKNEFKMSRIGELSYFLGL